jgi:hypothetical protein
MRKTRWSNSSWELLCGEANKSKSPLCRFKGCRKCLCIYYGHVLGKTFESNTTYTFSQLPHFKWRYLIFVMTSSNVRILWHTVKERPELCSESPRISLVCFICSCPVLPSGFQLFYRTLVPVTHCGLIRQQADLLPFASLCASWVPPCEEPCAKPHVLLQKVISFQPASCLTTTTRGFPT